MESRDLSLLLVPILFFSCKKTAENTIEKIVEPNAVEHLIKQQTQQTITEPNAVEEYAPEKQEKQEQQESPRERRRRIGQIRESELQIPPPNLPIRDFSRYFIIVNLGTGHLTKAIPGTDYQGYLKAHKKEYPKGYRVEIYRNGGLFDMIKEIPDFITITDYRTGVTTTHFEKPKDFIEKNKGNRAKYPSGFRITVYEGGKEIYYRIIN